MVLCSVAKRAVTTYDIIFERFKSKPDILILDELYAATARELFNIIKTTSSKVNSLMIVGHNPGITALLTEFKHIDYGNFHVKALDPTATCKLVSIMASTDSWLDIKDTPCIIDDVYWPSSSEILSKKLG